MTITPDDKNWTWVLERPCDECGCDTTSIQPADVAGLIRSNAVRWSEILGSGDAEVRKRPRHDVWSPLEYACHVRDVFTKFDERLTLMLTVDDPQFANWDQDASAVAGRYNEQDPATVDTQLRAAADRLAAAFASVQNDQWERPARRSDGARFTVATLSRYLIHDPIHHLYDVTGERYAVPT